MKRIAAALILCLFCTALYAQVSNLIPISLNKNVSKNMRKKIRSFPLRENQFIVYEADTVTNEPRFISVGNAVNRNVLLMKDSIEYVAMLSAGKIKDQFKLDNVRGITVFFLDRRRANVGSCIFCNYTVIDGRLIKINSFYAQDHTAEWIDSTLNDRLEKLTLPANQFLSFDTLANTVTICQLTSNIKAIDIDYEPVGDRYSPEFKQMFDLVRHWLHNWVFLYQYKAVIFQYIDRFSLDGYKGSYLDLEAIRRSDLFNVPKPALHQ